MKLNRCTEFWLKLDYFDKRYCFTLIENDYGVSTIGFKIKLEDLSAVYIGAIRLNADGPRDLYWSLLDQRAVTLYTKAEKWETDIAKWGYRECAVPKEILELLNFIIKEENETI